MAPRSIAILGKSGSGKDTQINILKDNLNPCLVISTGRIFREIANKNTLAGKRTKEVLEEGGLMPAWFASYLWQDEFVKKIKGLEHLIFGSNPRRLPEAEELDEVLNWLRREPVEAVLLDITDEEALKRMLKRGREDDTKENIKERLSWFNKEVSPVIEYYKQKERLHIVDGMGEVKKIAKDIAEKLKI